MPLPTRTQIEIDNSTMNKDVILELINKKINHIKFIKGKIKVLNDVDEITSEYLKELDFSKKYLADIYYDLNNDIIPEFFYSKIHNNVEIINIEQLFLVLNKPYSQINKDNFKSCCQNYPLNSFSSFVTYKFYKDLDFFVENSVVVGANGSGKSTLADNLKTIIDEKDGIVIPAQKLLIIPTFENTPNYNSSSREYDEYQKNYTNGKTTYNASKADSIPYEQIKKYGAEYKYVLKTLMAERAHIRNRFCINFSNDVVVNKTDLHSKLDTAIEIWNSLIEHRVMYINESNELKIKVPKTDKEYPAYEMSDGEKNILYLIGRVLLAKEDSLIIVDEPEMYLHKSIVNKLWDKLEVLRQNCIFVYLTHDLDFASSRKANKYWIKDFEYPINWNIDVIPENEIPESLLMKLLGSRKKILFCEGRNNSLDVKIFEILFSGFTISPLSSCKDVINYVRSFNKIPNKNIDAIGFIDRDFRTQEQLDKLNTENIYSYQVAEVENLFLIKEFIKEYASYKNETINLEDVENKILELFAENKIQQSSYFVSSFINYQFSESHLKKGNNLDDIKANLDNFTENLNIDGIYNERVKLLEQIIIDKEYEKAIMYYNNKGLLCVIENLLSLKSNTYRFKALEFLKNSEKAQNILRSTFPNI